MRSPKTQTPRHGVLMMLSPMKPGKKFDPIAGTFVFHRLSSMLLYTVRHLIISHPYTLFPCQPPSASVSFFGLVSPYNRQENPRFDQPSFTIIDISRILHTNALQYAGAILTSLHSFIKHDGSCKHIYIQILAQYQTAAIKIICFATLGNDTDMQTHTLLPHKYTWFVSQHLSTLSRH